jgi:hypothetical protein
MAGAKNDSAVVPVKRSTSIFNLLAIAAFFVLLYTFFFSGYTRCNWPPASVLKTESFKTAIISCLERYHSKFGEYPKPVTSGTRSKFGFGEHAYEVDAALMLYQVLSGDGNNHILTAIKGKRPSDGMIDNDEMAKIIMDAIPADMWKKTSDGYMLVDGYGHPFQYEAFVAGSTNTVNNTYDLWSFADQPLIKPTKAEKQDPKTSAKWIKNW